jgi:SAM-dependent methyltransferase
VGHASTGLRIELDETPGRGQEEESFVLTRDDGSSERIVLHDYPRVYAVPGLYEEVVQNRLGCASPQVLAETLADAVAAAGASTAGLRVLDVGAGNGVVGEELAARGVRTLVGSDNIPEARDAAVRDRPGLYADYLVGDIADLPAAPRVVREHGLNALVCAGALGLGHISAASFDRLWAAFPPGSWFAVTIGEALAEPGGSDFGDYLDDLARDPARGEIVHRERFRHRLTMAGAELYYLAIVARKASIPE